MGIKLQELVHRVPINASELAGNIITIDAPNKNIFSSNSQHNWKTGKFVENGIGLIYQSIPMSIEFDY